MRRTPRTRNEGGAMGSNGSGQNGQGDLRTDDEALSVLLDADIDKVMSGLDRIVEAAPSYAKLFARWQRQPWSTEDFDSPEDARQWADPDMFTEEERKFLTFGFSEFFIAEDRVTVELLPFALAAPQKEAQHFLTTQISDEAKHVVFWDRFYREVFGSTVSGISEQLEQHRSVVNDDWKMMFDDILHEAAERLRKDPGDFGSLVRGVTVYMVVIEGMLALTAARFMIKSLKERDWFPGFTQGFTAVNRDESRHVGFGVKFLADAIREDEGHKQTIQDTLQETLPVGTLALAPPMVDDPYDFTTPFGYTSKEIYEYAMRSLSKKLAAMGMEPLGAAA